MQLKRIFIALVVAVLSLPAAAQYNSGNFEASDASVYYGIRMGINSSWLGGDVDSKSMVGMTLGGVIGVRVAREEAIFVESGAYYTERGGKLGGGKAHLNYLEMPILIKGGFDLGSDVIMLPFIGPFFGLGVGGKTQIMEGGQEHKYSSWDNYKRFDMGFKFGCGLEYSLFYLELGYQFGVHDISKSSITARDRSLFANFGINF